MNVDWSNRSGEQFIDIIRIISEALSFEDGARWQTKIEDRVNLLADTPLMGCAVPHECFLYVPPDVDRLRQLVPRQAPTKRGVSSRPCSHSRSSASDDSTTFLVGTPQS